MKLCAVAFTLFACAAVCALAQTDKPTVRRRWICLEVALPSYTMPEHGLEFRTISFGEGCEIAVPIDTGESLTVTPDILYAQETLDGVFASMTQLQVAQAGHEGKPFSEFPHTDAYSSAIEFFNFSPDSPRAKFCALLPRAYVPMLGWKGITEPKPCSDKAPQL